MAVRDRLRKYAAQYLAPGEVIQAGFYAKRPGTGYNDCAVVATDRRLLLLGLNFFGPAQGLVSEAPRRTKLGPCSGRTHSVDAFGMSLTVDRRFFKDVAEADRTAEGTTPVAPARCNECGLESTEPTATCARCGASVSLQQPVAAAPTAPSAPAAAWYGSTVPPSAQGTSSYWTPGQPYYPYWPPGQPPPPSHARRKVLIGSGVVLAVLVALTAGIAVALAPSSTQSGTPAVSAPSLPSLPSAPPVTQQLTWDQLQPGDCLAGSNMGFGDATQWPETVTQVACTKTHEGEVYFAADLWSQSAKYPGQSSIDNQVSDRCTSAFGAYDGTSLDQSAFSFASIADDDSADWASGSRRVVCIAYIPSSSGPSGGTPVDYSIKHSDK